MAGEHRPVCHRAAPHPRKIFNVVSRKWRSVMVGNETVTRQGARRPPLQFLKEYIINIGLQNADELFNQNCSIHIQQLPNKCRYADRPLYKLPRRDLIGCICSQVSRKLLLLWTFPFHSPSIESFHRIPLKNMTACMTRNRRKLKAVDRSRLSSI